MLNSLFFRVEHSERVNHDLRKYSRNCSTLITTRKGREEKKSIHCGPWSLLELFNNEEVNYIASVSIKHALPYYKENRPFDKEINDVVMGPQGESDSQIKENFVFGCSSRHLINRYFPTRFREILSSRGFHIGIYSSNHVYTSQFQSVMNIDKAHEYMGSQNLI